MLYSCDRAFLNLTVALSAVVSLGCEGDPGAEWTPGSMATHTASSAEYDPCFRPNTGCACPAEGEVTDCGSVVERYDDYVTCSAGTRTCSGGVWGECLGARRTQEVPESRNGGLRILALGSSAVCPEGTDPCDPYCNEVIDTPIGFDPGEGFSSTPEGLTLTRTHSGVACTSLSITPSVTQVKVTSLSGSPLPATGNPVTLTAVGVPAECQTEAFDATWAVDKVDRAVISGTNGTNGKLTLVAPLGGHLRVTAFGLGTSGYIDLPVVVDILDTAPALATSPAKNLGAPAAEISLFGTAAAPLPGSVNSTAAWLYPYADTFFPLGLLAPTVQYSYASTSGNGKSVKVTLRYPSGKQLGESGVLFNYALIAKESNVIAASAGVPATPLDPQVLIPQAAWRAFELTARGNDADLVVQRLAGSLERESRRRIHFVDGQLKGSVYYNSYNSTVGGSTKTNVFGAVLKIRPGDSVPTNAVPYASGATNPHGLKTNGVCTVCHNVSANGSTLTFMSGYTNGPGCYGSDSSSGNYRGNACAFNIGSSPVQHIDTYRSGSTTEKYRFTYGAPYPDGSFYLTNAWDNVESYRSASGLVKTAGATSLASTGVPPLAVTPNFSPDGRALAYNDGTDGRVVLSEIGPCRQTNGMSSGEFIEVRNDSLVTVDLNGWSVRRSNGDTCFSFSGTTSAGSGTIKQLQRSTDCLNNTADTVRLYDASGELRSTHAYAYGSACGRYRSMASCAGTWSTSTSAADSTANDSCTIAATSDVSSDRLKVKDFACGAAAGSTACSTGAKTFSNERTVADCALTGCKTVGNPSFMPDGRGLLYQHVTAEPATSVAYGGAAGLASRLNTWQGAQAEIWLTNSDQSGGWAPRRLFALNGLTASGTSYLPLKPRTVSVPSGYQYEFHDGSKDTGWVYDRCDNNSPLIPARVTEHQLNYLPMVAPREAGGKHWVIFTSRRLYGSVATSSPWQTERSNNSSDYFGKFTTADANCANLDNYSPGSGLIETKKLWVAALDKDWETSGVDPSHPAFYLPGQELEAGNSHGYWVESACAAPEAACETSDDCCGGTGDDPSYECKVVVSGGSVSKKCLARGSCSQTGESCATSDDCCGAEDMCPEGGGVCTFVPPVVYEPQQLTRQYEGACPSGQHPVWRFFEWQASVQPGTKIGFSVQARWEPEGSLVPAAPLPMSTALPPPGGVDQSETWLHGALTVGDVLEAAEPGLQHAPYLVVTMDFVPDAAGQTAPTLHGWRQVFDCKPGN